MIAMPSCESMSRFGSGESGRDCLFCGVRPECVEVGRRLTAWHFFLAHMYRHHRGPGMSVTSPTLVAELNRGAVERGLPWRFDGRAIRVLVAGVRQAMKTERRREHIHVLCSLPAGVGRGYYIATTAGEARLPRRSMTRRAVSLFRATHGLDLACQRKFGESGQRRFRLGRRVRAKTKEVG